MKEEWKDIPGYEGHYQASTLGRIRSLDRQVKHHRYKRNGRKFSPGKVLKPSMKKSGYFGYSLIKDGSYKYFSGHILVALSFLEKQKPDDTVDHLNGIKHDNRPENLEYVSIQENIRRSYVKRNGFIKGCHQLPSGRWRALLSAKGKRLDLGVFDTYEEAHEKHNSEKAILRGRI